VPAVRQVLDGNGGSAGRKSRVHDGVLGFFSMRQNHGHGIHRAVHYVAVFA
jgi:hypothetical protein